MNIAKLINELAQKRIFLSVVDGKLKVKAPDGALTGDLLAALKQDKEEIIRFVKSNASFLSNAPETIPSFARDGDFPLSISQKRLWYLDRLEGSTSSTYHISGALRLKGDLRVDAMFKVFKTIVARQEALRTIFLETDGEPRQVIQDAEGFEPGLVDLRDIAPVDRHQRVCTLIAEHGTSPIFIDRDYMLRITLLVVDDYEYVLLWKMHHIASDGSSIGVLINEMSTLYRAYIQGLDDPLPKLAVQYPDFARWQQDWLKGEVLQKQLDYWKHKLQDAPKLHELPLDLSRPAAQRFRGDHVTFQLDHEITRRLNQLSQQHNATLFMTMLAAFCTVLKRHSLQDDIVVGTPIAGRTHAELAPIIGFFLNTLVLRTRFSGDPAFIDVLNQAKANTLEAYTHQYIPFEMLAENLSQGDLSFSPVFQIMMVMQNYEKGELSLPGLTLIKERNKQSVAKFDLTLTLVEFNDHIVTDLEYSTDLFERASIERIGDSLKQVLARVVNDPQQPLSRLIGLTETDRSQLSAWNPPLSASTTPELFHRMVERQAMLRPQNLAVSAPQHESLTYAELNLRSNRLARQLIRDGVVADTLVGLCMDRGPELAVGLLAILKANAAYVPLDPLYPETRLRQIAGDAGLGLILTQSSHVDLLALEGVRLLVVDEPQSRIDIEAHDGQNLVALGEDDPQRLIYVIYTSGSTGTPKGVMISHANVHSYCAAAQAHYCIGLDDRVMQFASCNFDAFIEEFAVTLFAGGTLVFRDESVLADSEFFWRFIEEQRISVVSLPTAFWHLLVEEMGESHVRIAKGCLRLCILGGESLGSHQLSVWHQRVGAAVQLLNTYGPTEATVVATVCDVSAGGNPVATPPIGRPLGNTRAYVVDEQLQLVPVGVAGELCLGGAGVGRGYLGREALTAERFVHVSWTGERLYRTGDRVRWNNDGQLLFLGRLDDQVKIRGFRIEPGEAAAALRQLAGIKDAVVVYRELPGVGGQLVAYVVVEAGELDVASLRAGLAVRLPDYLVPAFYVALPALPLNANGKVDRKRLPEPERSTGSGYVAPRTALERTLCALWEQLLQRERVGIEDNFFELGGHSLLVTRLVSAMRTRCGHEVALREVFEAPTVAQLAARLTSVGVTPALPPLVPVDRSGPLPLSFAQQRLWFIDRLEGGSLQYNIPSRFTLRGALDERAFVQALTTLLARHEALRTRFEEVDGEPRQRIDPLERVRLPLKRVDLTALAPQAQRTVFARVAEEEAGLPFDLGRDPMLRVQLVKYAADHYRVLLTLHHIAADGWSMQVLQRELQTLYAAYRAGTANPLPPLAVQYADYAHWQREWLQGEALSAQLDYWRTHLADLPTLHGLPLDHPRPARQTFAGRSYTHRLEGEVVARLRAQCQGQGVTIFMLLQTAFAAWVARCSGSDDVVMGVPVAGRTHELLEPLIGLFVNTLVLRSRVDVAQPVEALLSANRQTILEAYTYQHLPFEHLVEMVNPPRSLSHSPIFQIMFNHQQEEEALEGRMRGAAQTGWGESVEKFDLSLSVLESADALTFTWNVNHALFEDASVERWAGYYAQLLARLSLSLSGTVAELMPLMAEDGARLAAWNATELAASPYASVQSRFEAQVRATPEATAVVFEGRSWSYRTLDEAANRLAHALRAQGIGAEDRVGLCLPRSAELVSGVLGILKSGGAYVPLDPGYPPARIGWMLADAGVRAVVSERSLAPLVSTAGVPVLSLDDPATLAGMPSTAVDDTTVPGDLAYLIYTSGSTGTPKGVMIEHRNTNALIDWALSQYSARQLRCVAAATSICFDLSVFELFVPLCAGGCVGMISNALDIASIAALDASMLNTVPSAMQSLVAADGLGENVEVINLAGEALSAALVQQIHRACPAVAVYNLYGPSEDTTYSTVALISQDSPSPPIGRPISNTRAYVVDEQLQLVPVGVAGELCLGGAGVGRGYLGREALTAERFVHVSWTGERLYRTGDRVRWNNDGQLLFLGRLDDQVKIRGFRIEPGEAAAALRQLAGIKDAVVVYRELPGVGGQLVAYVVVEAGELDVASLRAGLAVRLPDYLVPAFYVALPALPLNANGKVDRKRLPEPERSTGSGYVAPRTALERTLCALWEQLLQRERVGIEDNFFELGGHSLLVTRLVSAMRTRCGHEVALREVFEAPTVAQLAARLTSVGVTPALPPLVPVDRSGPLPLSFAQQRLWFIDRLEGGSSQYNIPSRFTLRGALDERAFVQALTTLLARHEALRTRFEEVDGEPRQRIDPLERVRLPLKRVDLTALAPQAQRTVFARVAEEEAGLPFDLGRDPMLRVQLVKYAADHYRVLLTLHHIAADGWSMQVLQRELQTLYAAYRAGTANPLPPLAVQYADYAHWQREWLQGEALSSQLDYWRTHLADLPTLHGLPLDHPRPARQTFAGRSYTHRLEGEVVARLRAQCQGQGVTIFMLLQTAFAAWVARCSGSDDVVMGVPVAGRTHELLEPLIGLFVNTLVLRSRVDVAQPVEALLSANRQTILEAYTYQHLPFEHLVEMVNPPRSLSHSPIFQIMFNHQQEEEALEGRMRGAAQTGWGESVEKFDLSLSVLESADAMTFTWNVNHALFEDASVERWAGYYAQLLARLSLSLSGTVAELMPLMAEDGARLAAWNATELAASPYASVQSRFEAQVRATPEATAVVFEGRSWSYRTLDEAANRLAHALRAQGIGAEDRVGLCLPRSAELVSGVLGILKSGGAYVPLDPGYPPARIGWMLADAGVRAVVSERSLAPLVSTAGVPVLSLDDPATLAGMPSTAVDDTTVPGDLAYLIYTSGSTGTPKGVMIEHRNTNALIDWALSQYSARQLRCVAAATSICFDLSVFELFVPLCAGGCVGMISNALDIASIAALDASMLNTVPSAMQSLVAADGLGENVEVINLAGEALSAALVQQIHRACPAVAVYNLYGPSEDTTYSTVALISQDSPSPPIGRPISNTRAYVVDEQLQLVPVGVAGELCLGGAGVGRGYLGREALTAERFVHVPWTGERLYRTGDRVRWNNDGQLLFLGRLDDQVKIRGFRIEPGEAAAALRQLAGIKDAVVVYRELPGVGGQLVAYVVVEAGELDVASLRAGLAARLPDYLVPAFYVALPALPLNANGKVDRKRLPEPERSTGSGYVAPRTALERTLCALWEQLLQRERVGIEDNFFELGGHSLLVTRLVSAMRTRCGHEVALREVFEAPTVAQLAARLTSVGVTPALPPLVPVDRSGPLPLSFAQQRLWFIDRLEGGSSQYNIPSRFTLRGALDERAFVQALTTLLARHEALRTRFEEVDGEPRQRIDPLERVRLPLKRVDLTALAPQAQRTVFARVAEEEAGLPFDLGRDPMLRVQLVKYAADHYRVLLTLHHIAADGWSMQVLQRELQTLYAAYRAGTANPLPPLAVQYADYAHWQREWLQGEALSSQLDYWRTHLADLPTLHGLPLDHPRPARQTFAGRSYTHRLEGEVVARLRAQCQGQGVTIFMLLQTAFAAWVARCSGSDDVVMGVPVAGRTHELLEPLIGLFVNTLVLRSRVDVAQPVEALLSANRQTILEAYTYQHLPFEHLVEMVNPPRSLSHSPIFQIMFNHQQEEEALEGRMRGAAQTGWGESVEKFDLSLSVLESADAMTFTWNVNHALFEDASVERWAGYYAQLLARLSLSLSGTVAELMPLMAEDGARLAAWNATELAASPYASVQSRFEAQVRATPEATAVVFEGRSWSYRTLDEAANRLAHALRAQGIGAEDRVGLCLPRSAELVSGVLGILKSGGAYVPLDPGYPPARIGWMLADAGVRAVVSERSLAPLVSTAGVPVLSLDDPATLAGMPSTAVDDTTVPGDLAYLIYTSGSTGTPKGVMIEHRNTNALIDWALSQYSARQLRCVAAATSICFDLSVFELFVPLCAGGCVGMISNALDIASIAALDASMLNTVPSAMQSLVAADGLGENVEVINLAGEALSAALVQQIHRACPAVAVYNLYGPSEDTTYSTVALISQDSPSPPIGRPISNTRAYVVDEQLQLVPVGVAGELCLGGAGVGRGYLGREALTAERFVHVSWTGERLYRTGDRVRWNNDGQLLFLGRLDDQVKIRGFRIEPGEAAAALRQLAGIKDAVVVYRELPGVGGQLVAYVVVEAGELDVASLRAGLAVRLPDYLVPAFYVALPALPLNANGKVDRKRLPEPERSTGSGYVAPRTALERTLCALWEQLLQRERVGIEDNFFELGGHSLLVTRLVSAMRTRCGVQLRLSDIFVNPNVAALVAYIENTGSRIDMGWVPLIGRDDGASLIFCVPGAGMSAASLQPLERALRGCRALQVFASRGQDGIEKPHSDMSSMVDAYLQALLARQPQGPYRLMGHSFGGCVAHELALRLERLGHDVDLILLDSYLDHRDAADSATELQALAPMLRRMVTDRGIQATPGKKLNSIAEWVEWVENRMAEQDSSNGVDDRRLLHGMADTALAQLRMQRAFHLSGRLKDGIALFWASEGGMRDLKLRESVVARCREASGAQGNPTVIEVGGDHFSMHDETNAQALAEAIRSYFNHSDECRCKVLDHFGSSAR